MEMKLLCFQKNTDNLSNPLKVLMLRSSTTAQLLKISASKAFFFSSKLTQHKTRIEKLLNDE
jgi:hypothetical protein